MRKKYVAPVIAVEHYELTQTIAACVTKIGFGNNNCVENDKDSPPGLADVASWYFIDTEACYDVPDSDDALDGICYHTSVSAVFTS